MEDLEVGRIRARSGLVLRRRVEDALQPQRPALAVIAEDSWTSLPGAEQHMRGHLAAAMLRHQVLPVWLAQAIGDRGAVVLGISFTREGAVQHCRDAARLPQDYGRLWEGEAMQHWGFFIQRLEASQRATGTGGDRLEQVEVGVGDGW